MYACTVCEEEKISEKVFEKLDMIAAADDDIICKKCHDSIMGNQEAIVIEKARAKDAYLVKIHWSRG